jgi:hypothetical protein
LSEEHNALLYGWIFLFYSFRLIIVLELTVEEEVFKKVSAGCF